MAPSSDKRATMSLVYFDDEEVGLTFHRGYGYIAGDDRFFQSEAEIDEYIASLPRPSLTEILGVDDLDDL